MDYKSLMGYGDKKKESKPKQNKIVEELKQEFNINVENAKVIKLRQLLIQWSIFQKTGLKTSSRISIFATE